MSTVSEFQIHLQLEDGYRFRVDFDRKNHIPMWLDEPAPLGKDTAPNAARILAAAIGNCLSASLLFCMKRAGAELSGIEATVHVEIVRDEEKRLRIGRVSVALEPTIAPEQRAHLEKCLAMFEDFCVVTQSVRHGIDVDVNVTPKVT